jgi:hypothetical protein
MMSVIGVAVSMSSGFEPKKSYDSRYPVREVAPQAQVRERALRCSDLARIPGEFIAYSALEPI